jgi:hypothetical protein
MARATAAGVPAEGAKATVAAFLDAAFARELPQAQVPKFPGDGIHAFRAWGDLHAFLLWRQEPVTSLVAEIRVAAHPDTRILLIDFEGSWWGGVDPAACAAACDGILHCAYFTAQDRLGPLMAETRALLAPGQTLIAGFQLFHPEVEDADDLALRTAAVAPHVDGVNYYNLGLVPPPRLAWIGRALAAARA